MSSKICLTLTRLKMKKLTFILGLVFATFLISCGGGDDPTPTPEPTAPVVTTFVGAVEPTSIEVGGSVTSDGNSALTEVYVEATPLTGGVTLRHDFTPSGVKNYKIVLTAVSNTDYSVKFTAKNSKGSTVGNSVPVKTGMSFPIISNFQVTNVNKIGANFSFNTLSFAGSVPTEVGVNIYTTTNGQPDATPVTGLSVQVSTGTPGTVNFQSSYNGGSPGKLMFAKAYAKLSDGTTYHGSEAFFTHTGYYLGQNIGTGKVVIVWNDGSNAKLMPNSPVKNTTLSGTEGRPSYGFENLWVGATSENGLANTEMLAAVNSSVPYGQPGYVDPNGAFKLAVAYTMAGVSSDFYIPTKSDWEEIWANRVAIFGNSQNWYNYFPSLLYTSTEKDSNYSYVFSTNYDQLVFGSRYKVAYTDGSSHPAAFVVCDLPVVVN
jgi:hypothetical protein